jgi:hypothetical protein
MPDDSLVHENSCSMSPGSHLSWSQPSSLTRDFELYSGDRRIGDLSFSTVSAASATFQTADAAKKCWLLQEQRVRLKSCVTIRESEAKDDPATYHPLFLGGGWLEFTTGRRFRWKSTRFWGAEWGFVDSEGVLLFVVKPNVLNLLKIEASIEIRTPCQDLVELPALLILGWYLKVCDSYASR